MRMVVFRKNIFCKLKAGFLADFVVLSGSPTVPKTAKVLRTVVNGKVSLSEIVWIG